MQKLGPFSLYFGIPCPGLVDLLDSNFSAGALILIDSLLEFVVCGASCCFERVSVRN